jgi:hypothetical protein
MKFEYLFLVTYKKTKYIEIWQFSKKILSFLVIDILTNHCISEFYKKKSWEKIPIKKYNFFTYKAFFVFGGQFSDINNLTKKLQPKKGNHLHASKTFFSKILSSLWFKK